jgi:ribosomal protein L11 methyltransferase
MVSTQDDAQALVAEASSTAGIAPPAFSIAQIADQDWVRASQAQFAPLAIGARLWIGPSWHQPPAQRIAIRIDPGLAFGTGSHPTTKLVLAYLERNLKPGERVLDYGCGSGILAIAAAKLGAAQVDAVDLDPQAVETTRANAAANGVALSSTLPDALPAGDYDIVVSNILAQPLILLAPLLAQRGACIALSGILQTQAQEVAQAYEPWFQMKLSAEEDGWVLLTGKRR